MLFLIGCLCLSVAFLAIETLWLILWFISFNSCIWFWIFTNCFLWAGTSGLGVLWWSGTKLEPVAFACYWIFLMVPLVLKTNLTWSLSTLSYCCAVGLLHFIFCYILFIFMFDFIDFIYGGKYFATNNLSKHLTGFFSGISKTALLKACHNTSFLICHFSGSSSWIDDSCLERDLSILDEFFINSLLLCLKIFFRIVAICSSFKFINDSYLYCIL